MSVTVLDQYYLSITLLVTIGLQFSFFVIAYLCQFDYVTDFGGTTNFLLLAWLTFFLSGTYYPRQLLVTILVTLWGLRLGGFLLYRVLKRKKDVRFDEMRAKFWSFLGFWVFQMIWVWTVSTPVILTNAARVNTPLNALDYVGIVIWVIGFVEEAIADQHKYSYVAGIKDLPTESMPKKPLNTGVWRWSRHPNYFGEIVCWIGIYCISCNVYAVAGNDMPYGWLSFMSPLLTALLLTLVSGIPMAESKDNKRYASEAAYRDYRDSTSPLIPLPPALYRRLPPLVKKVFFFEWPIYAKHLNTGPTPIVTTIPSDPLLDADRKPTYNTDGSSGSTSPPVR